MSETEEEVQMYNFIKVYKNMPELWNAKSEKYKNKNIRKRSYEKLLIEYKKNKSNATVDDLKRKITNMRTCYRRELKKNLQSQRSEADDIYIPSLWYFDSFGFLQDLEMPLPGRSNLSSDEDEGNTSTSIRSKQQNKPKKFCAVYVRTEFLKKATDHLESSKNKEASDEASIYASGWACMLRQMASDQQLFAKQAVDEIMLLGRMKKLSINFLHSANCSSVFMTQDLAQTSTAYSSSTHSPHLTYNPLDSREVSCDFVEIVPDTQFNSVRKLFSSSQFQ